MKNKNILKKWFIFDYRDCDAVRKYFEEMALKGWAVKDINTFMTFEKTEPQIITYSVEFFDGASIFDTNPNKKSFNFIEECRSRGWDFVCSMGKTFVFKTSDPNTPPIINDEKVKYKLIVKSTIKQNIIQWFILPPLLTMNFILQLFNFEFFITQNISLFYALIILLFWIATIAVITSFLNWKHKAKQKLKNGGSVSFNSLESLKKKNKRRWLYSIIMILILVLYAVLALIYGNKFDFIITIVIITFIALVLFVSVLIQRSKLKKIAAGIIIAISAIMIFNFMIIAVVITLMFNSRKTTLPDDYKSVVTWAEDEELPLDLNDLGYNYEKLDNDKSVDSSIFASLIDCSSCDYDNHTTIHYKVLVSKYDWVLNNYVKSEKRYKSFKESEATAWNAEKAYIGDDIDSYTKAIIVYDDKVLILSGDYSLDKDEILLITNKLNLKPDSSSNSDKIEEFSYLEDISHYEDSECGIIVNGFKNTKKTLATTKVEAVSLAKNEVTVEYNSISVAFDESTNIWRILFYTKNLCGGDESVYINTDGVSQGIIYGE